MTRALPVRTPAVSLALAALAFLSPWPRALAEDAPVEQPVAPTQDDGPSLTVYSSADPAGFDPQQFISQQRTGYSPNFAWQVPGFAVVRETRRVTVPKGTGDVPFSDVAEFIDPTTVSFADLSDPAGTAVLEQSFRFDLTSPDKLLERYLGREIGVDLLKDGLPVGSVRGDVLSVNQGTVVLRTADGGLRFVTTRDPGLRLPSLPEGLLSKPTLVWKLASDTGGEHRVRTTYQTAGLTWRADYNLVVDAADKTADLGAWVTMLNVAGAGWKDARLKLIAGDVQRIQSQPPRGGFSGSRKSLDAAAAPGFEEKAFFEYHLYTLPRRTDVLSNQTQQITLFPTARDVSVEKVLVYYGLPENMRWSYTPSARTDRDIRTASNTKVDVYLRWKNSKENHLGMPLPRGKVRVFKKDDADGTLEFVGEDLVDHTPKDETVLVKVGQSFDVVGDRTQTTFEAPPGRNEMTEGFKITLRNHKDVDVRVSVRENLFRWLNWEILSSSDPFTKIDAHTIHFDVDVKANETKIVTYTVRYSGW
jgi:hypothetical protein